jgi:xylulokinase
MKNVLLGIDLGTSSVKAVLLNHKRDVVAQHAREYPIVSVGEGMTEQPPETWWQAVVETVRTLVSDRQYRIDAMGVTGQMHGTVLLDDRLEVIRPAIIWTDQRGQSEIASLEARIGRDALVEITGTRPAAGFMITTLAWLAQHEAESLGGTHAILLPKDYVRMKLTGGVATDPTDAAGTGLLDVRRRLWSRQVAEALQLPLAKLPPILGSSAVAGAVTGETAALLGMRAGTPVVTGCADQIAQAISGGLIDPGTGSITIGSGGQIFMPIAAPDTGHRGALHTFCHAPEDRWYLLGAMLTAGLSLRWLRDLLDLHGDDAYTTLSAAAASVPPGAEGLIYLPYLTGERAPHFDAQARGGFVGLTLRHHRGHLARAVMEGVAFALRQIIEVMRASGAVVDTLIAAGGGLGSAVWRQITADVIGVPLSLQRSGDHTAVGAALLAGIGVGVFADYEDAAHQPETKPIVTLPSPELTDLYDRRYQQFSALYPALRSIFGAGQPQK